ncbi:MAG: DUF2238 domain-containing protein [Patescibacteria group bacterium]
MVIKKYWWLILFNVIYVLIFAWYYLSVKNYEFLWYIAILTFFLVLILTTLNRTRFDGVVLGGLSLWGLLHMLGGGLKVGEGVLYKFVVFDWVGSGESQILKFDQVVHFFGFGITTIIFYHLLKPYLGSQINFKVLYPLLVLGGMGFGALNEVVEFAAVAFFGQTGVGGYWNTALDLVFNMLGAIVAIFFIHYYYKPKINLAQNVTL